MSYLCSVGRNLNSKHCGTKRQYTTKAKAKTAMYRYIERHPGHSMCVYRCAFCKFWHIGHKTKSEDYV